MSARTIPIPMKRLSCLRSLLLPGLLALLMPEAALAHGSVAGIGEFYNGLLHPMLAPAHLLGLLGLALWLGQGALQLQRHTLIGLLLGLIAGALSARLAGDPDTDAWLYLLAAAAAAGAAASFKGPALLRSLLALLLGLAIGLGSGAPSLSGVPRFAAFAGSVSGACLLLSVLAVGVEELVVRRRQVWALHACRILSAWVIAIALLLLAYAWR